jgi:hypothetical protein
MLNLSIPKELVLFLQGFQYENPSVESLSHGHRENSSSYFSVCHATMEFIYIRAFSRKVRTLSRSLSLLIDLDKRWKQNGSRKSLQFQVMRPLFIRDMKTRIQSESQNRVQILILVIGSKVVPRGYLTYCAIKKVLGLVAAERTLGNPDWQDGTNAIKVGRGRMFKLPMPLWRFKDKDRRFAAPTGSAETLIRKVHP